LPPGANGACFWIICDEITLLSTCYLTPVMPISATERPTGVSRTSKKLSIYLANRGIPYRQRAAGAGHSCPTSTGEVDEDAGRQPACDAGAADPGPAELVADHGRRFNDASSRRSITLKLEPISASP
jgi:hypothetical protein